MQRTCSRCLQPLARLARSGPTLAASSATAPFAPARLAPPASRAFSAPAHASSSPFLSLSSRPPRTPLATSLAPTRRGIVCPAQPPPNPPDGFEPVEDDLADGESLEINLTDAAIKQILRAQTIADDPSLALRLAVESGGCHGYQYKMQVTSAREPDDYLFAAPAGEDGATAALVVDAASLPLVKGSTVDYATELIGSAFRIRENPQSKDAGCGCGVSWELKDLDL
ncbi:hypothetical protein JCM3770_000175 [Rhodotorula araucariae]